MMSIFVHTDCCDYVVLDFRQQLKTSLKGVEMSGGSKWERGGVGDIIGSFKKDIIIPPLTFSTFCRLSLNMRFLILVIIRGLVGGTHDKVEGHSEIQMEAWGKCKLLNYKQTEYKKFAFRANIWLF